MLEHITAAINPRTLAVPDTDNAVLVGASCQGHLLCAPDCSRCQILVDTGLKDHPRLIEKRLGPHQLLIKPTEW